MPIEQSQGPVVSGAPADELPGGSALDRREVLRRSGLVAGGLAMGVAAVRDARAAPAPAGVPVEIRKVICPHCSVGCTMDAEVANGKWIGLEPSWDSPFNRGSLCAKGAAARAYALGERRLQYPLKLAGGVWSRITWDQALAEIGEKLNALRQSAGPDSIHWLGSASLTNETAYLLRKLVACWGTNNVDHETRMCDAPTIAGLDSTFGFGAMTNSVNDIRNAKTILVIAADPAEAQPVAMQHLLVAKEINRANVVVIDPRFTRTAAHATEFVRLRPGTEVAAIHGLLWHIFRNGWEDKEFIRQRVDGMEEVGREVQKWNSDDVEKVTGVPGAQLRSVAERFAKEKPSTLIWSGDTVRHANGTAVARALSILLLATGSVGGFGNGANVLRDYGNAQGASDLGLDCGSLPLYTGLSDTAWKHWSRVWEIDYDWLAGRFNSRESMETPGIASTRWFDAVLSPPEQAERSSPLRALFVMGHAANSIARLAQAKEALGKLDLLVVADPYPGEWAALAERQDDSYLLPTCTAFETTGSRTATNRALQWSEQAIKPLFESKGHLALIHLLADRLGFAAEMFKTIKVDDGAPDVEDVLREINRGGWPLGYSGQSPERLKLHLAHQKDFDQVTLRAGEGPCKGEYYGLPWPCWGTPEQKHPGTPMLYNVGLHVREGGGAFRPRFGAERGDKRPDGSTVKVSLLATGSATIGSTLKDGYPEFTYGALKRLRWDRDLTGDERATIEAIGGAGADAVSWAYDLSGGIQRIALAHGCVPSGNGRARASAWNLPDPVPLHREPIYSPRPDLAARYPANADAVGHRMPNPGFTTQKAAIDRGIARDFPLILSTGQLAEYDGGGAMTRANRWLAELQQEMFVEIHPADAAARGIKDGAFIWVSGPEGGARARMKAHVTERVGKGATWMPVHFGGWYQGSNLRVRYPPGIDPFVLGASASMLMAFGYDPVTSTPESNATLCQIVAA